MRHLAVATIITAVSLSRFERGAGASFTLLRGGYHCRVLHQFAVASKGRDAANRQMVAFVVF